MKHHPDEILLYKNKRFFRKGLKIQPALFCVCRNFRILSPIENVPSTVAVLSTTEKLLITKEVDSIWTPTEGSFSYTHTYTRLFLFLSAFSLYVHSVFSDQMPASGYKFICLTSVTGGTLEAILRLQ